MIDELKRLTVECWRSRLGRALFFIHLLVAMTLVGYFWNNINDPALDVLAIRKVVFVLDWPSIRLQNTLFRIFGTPPASRFRDGVTVFFFSIPWWFYGYGAELAAAKVRDFIGS